MESYEYYKTELGVLYCEDCLKGMPLIPNESINMVLTSPPYDNLRDYRGYEFDFFNIAKELHRILKVGGVVVWVVGDATIDGSETGTSFKQALYFKEIGFNLHDTMIYEKDSPANPSSNRYHQLFEYMFVFSKGEPSTFNPIKDKINTYTSSKSGTMRLKDGSMVPKKDLSWGEYGMRNNIWRMGVGYMKSTKDKIAYQHPAIFPDILARDHIISWSNRNDVVFDPFIGSGTTAVACEKLGRRWIGIEISEDYCKIAKERILTEARQIKMF